MPYKLRTFHCVVCGTETSRRLPKGAEARCVRCGIERSVANAVGLHRHSGLYYARWAEGMARAAARAAQLVELGDQVDQIG